MIIDDIKRLKQEKNAVILAHYYQNMDVCSVADYVGDSFELSKKAAETKADIIVFCGVRFMAESAKILSPYKKVLLPVKDAGCPMADMIDVSNLRALKAVYPRASIVCYVNSSAEVKAESDICCTSSNALRVVESLVNDEIIFIPDKHLGRYVAAHFPDKHFVFIDGYCPIHAQVTARDIKHLKARHPDAAVAVHPECPAEVVALADYVGSTTGIISYASLSEHNEIIIGTEQSIITRLNLSCPEKKFYPAVSDFICPDMKKTTLEELYNSLETESYEIKLSDEIIEKASGCMTKMLSI